MELDDNQYHELRTHLSLIGQEGKDELSRLAEDLHANIEDYPNIDDGQYDAILESATALNEKAVEYGKGYIRKTAATVERIIQAAGRD